MEGGEAPIMGNNENTTTMDHHNSKGYEFIGFKVRCIALMWECVWESVCVCVCDVTVVLLLVFARVERVCMCR